MVVVGVVSFAAPSPPSAMDELVEFSLSFSNVVVITIEETRFLSVEANTVIHLVTVVSKSRSFIVQLTKGKCPVKTATLNHFALAVADFLLFVDLLNLSGLDGSWTMRLHCRFLMEDLKKQTDENEALAASS